MLLYIPYKATLRKTAARTSESLCYKSLINPVHTTGLFLGYRYIDLHTNMTQKKPVQFFSLYFTSRKRTL